MPPATGHCWQQCHRRHAAPPLPARLLALAQSALWGFLAFLLWTQTFATNLALSLLLLMVTILLFLESACPSHPHLYRVRRSGSTAIVAPCRQRAGPAGGSSAGTAPAGTRWQAR